MMKLREKSSRGKFEPKVPVRRKKKVDAAKREGEEEGGEATLSSELLKLVKQSQDGSNAQGRRLVRAPTRVAFGFGSPSSGRETVDFHKGGIDGGKGGGGVREGRTIDKKSLIKSSQGAHECILLEDTSGRKEKESTEPWDYSKYYPMTLPLRPPFSRTTDEQEFGDTASDKVPDENAQPSAEELNLRVESEQDRLLLFQIPSILPLSNFSRGNTSQRSDTISLNNLPSGRMGKLLVYKSGTVKLQLGAITFEAVPGSECTFAQELAAINPVSKHCCFMGDVTQRVSLIPDIDDLLEGT